MSQTETSRWREGIEHRFAIGTPVWVFLGDGQWVKARVQDLQTKTSAGVMPYQVQLPDGPLLCAPVDSDACIRQALDTECLWDAPKDNTDTPMLPSGGESRVDAGKVIVASDRRDRLRRL